MRYYSKSTKACINLSYESLTACKLGKLLTTCIQPYNLLFCIYHFFFRYLSPCLPSLILPTKLLNLPSFVGTANRFLYLLYTMYFPVGYSFLGYSDFTLSIKITVRIFGSRMRICLKKMTGNSPTNPNQH